MLLRAQHAGVVISGKSTGICIGLTLINNERVSMFNNLGDLNFEATVRKPLYCKTEQGISVHTEFHCRG